MGCLCTHRNNDVAGGAICCTLDRRPTQEDIMAKGQQRSTKEKKKPKAEWNKKKKGSPLPPSYIGQGQPKLDIMVKKG
jgi:hypothetical protein